MSACVTPTSRAISAICPASFRRKGARVPDQPVGSRGSGPGARDCATLTSTIFDPCGPMQVARRPAQAAPVCRPLAPSSADVYPLLYVSSDACGIVALKTPDTITPTVVNPKPSGSDPLGQRGRASWKSMTDRRDLNDLWMVRAEVAAAGLTADGHSHHHGGRRHSNPRRSTHEPASSVPSAVRSCGRQSVPLKAALAINAGSAVTEHSEPHHLPDR